MDYNLFLELMTEEERRAHKARTEQQLASSGSGSGSIGSGTFDSKVPKILPQAAASTGVEHTDRHGPIHARRVSLTKWPSNPSAVDGSDNPAIAGGSSASTTAGVSTVTGSVHSGGGSGSSSGETRAYGYGPLGGIRHPVPSLGSYTTVPARSGAGGTGAGSGREESPALARRKSSIRCETMRTHSRYCDCRGSGVGCLCSTSCLCDETLNLAHLES